MNCAANFFRLAAEVVEPAKSLLCQRDLVAGRGVAGGTSLGLSVHEPCATLQPEASRPIARWHSRHDVERMPQAAANDDVIDPISQRTKHGIPNNEKDRSTATTLQKRLLDQLRA